MQRRNKNQRSNVANSRSGKFITQGSLVNTVPKPALVIIQPNQPTTTKPKSKLLILRGAPGSGKTTLAKTLFSDWKIVSTNDYFTVNGVYCFDGSKLQAAHNNCLDRVTAYLKEGYNIVVDNCFRTKAELARYYELKQIAEIRIYRVVSQFKNIHNVPDEIVRKNLLEYEKVDIEKEVKLDLQNKKLILCDEKNEESYKLPMLKYTGKFTRSSRCCPFNIDSMIFYYYGKSKEYFLYKEGDEVTISYYQKPGGINVLVEIKGYIHLQEYMGIINLINYQRICVNDTNFFSKCAQSYSKYEEGDHVAITYYNKQNGANMLVEIRKVVDNV